MLVRPLLIGTFISFASVAALPPRTQSSSAPARSILLQGTVVAMNEAGDVLRNGRVLVRNGRIAAVWDGPIPPDGVSLEDAARPAIGPNAIIYPGLINLHDH